MERPLVAVVGAGHGIGRSVARTFAERGFRAALVCKPDADESAFLDAIGDGGVMLRGDVGDPAALDACLDEIAARVGFPDVLVYNASLGAPGGPSTLALAGLERHFRVNVTAALRCAQWALPAMRGRGRGTMLFTGGGLALDPKGTEASLSIGKAGLRSLALCLAQEVEPEGLHVATVTICGFVQTGTPLDADRVASYFWALHAQPRDRWEREVILRPSA